MIVGSEQSHIPDHLFRDPRGWTAADVGYWWGSALVPKPVVPVPGLWVRMVGAVRKILRKISNE